MQLLFGVPIMKLRLHRWRSCQVDLRATEKYKKCRDMLDELEWTSLEARREQSSLTFFYKIHSGTVSLDKDKYLTPAPNIRSTRSFHELQYTRYLAYSEALKNHFSLGLFQYGIVSLPRWSHPGDTTIKKIPLLPM